MSTRWERLAGDTGAFALKLAFARDPDDGQAADPDVCLSWGGFQIWVEGRNLCAHREAGVRIESAHWYLLPLIEWFVEHWNPLLHEERLPARNLGDTAWASLRATRFPPAAIENDERQARDWDEAWQTWWMRHALRAASHGGLFPDVVVRRLRDHVEVSWGPTRTAGMPEHVDFAESASGFSRLPPAAVADPLHELLADASEYLLSCDPSSGRFRKLRKRVAALRAAGHRERRLMWLAGLGTNEQAVHAGWRRVKRYLSACADLPRRAMLEASASPLVVTGSCQASLTFGSLAPNVGKADVLALADVMVALHGPGSASRPFESIRAAVPIEDSGEPSWHQGYELAERFHDRFDGTFVGDAFVDVDGILEKLGVEVVDRGLSDETVRGVAFDGKRHRPGILVNSRHNANEHPFGRRFTLAHELCHLLFDRDAGVQLAMASGPWAPRDVERRANAFAAMVLMPNPLVQRAVAALTGALETKDAVAQLANRLRAGFESTLWHLENLGYLDDFARQRIEEEARRQPG